MTRARLQYRELAALLDRSRRSRNSWAQAFGISKGYLSLLASGRREYPGEELRQRLLESLGVGFDELFTWEEDPTSAADDEDKVVVAIATPKLQIQVTRSSVRQPWSIEVRPFSSSLRNASESVVQDLRVALRSLSRAPGFALVAILTLAVGIGATTAIFSVLDATLLRRLPFPRSEELMKLYLEAAQELPLPVGGREMIWSYPKFEILRRSQTVFQSLAVVRQVELNLNGSGLPERIRGEAVGSEYHNVLGVQPMLGSDFSSHRENQDSALVLLGYGLWMRVFGGNPTVLGQAVVLDNRPHTIVGVLPSGFLGLTGVSEIWLPVETLGSEQLSQAGSHAFEVVGRRKQGVGAEQARAEVRSLGRVVDEIFPSPFGGGPWSATAHSLNENRVDGRIQRSMWLLFGAVGFVLLIGSLNLASLLLVRSLSRRTEVAIRQALGAGRRRILRQLLTEGVLLAVLGGLAGLALAFFLMIFLRDLSSLVPLNPRATLQSGLTLLSFEMIRINTPVLLFALGLGLLTGIFFGLAPGWKIARADLVQSLREGRAQAAGSPLGARRLLVGLEIAFALILLVGSGLLLESLYRLRSAKTGFSAEQVFLARIALPENQYDRNQAGAFFRELSGLLSNLPGVVKIGLNTCSPLSGSCNFTNISSFLGRPDINVKPTVSLHFVNTGYFEALDIALLQGRNFSDRDRSDSPRVVLISKRAAAEFWPDQSPLGEVISLGQGGYHTGAEIVGVVDNVHYSNIEQMPDPAVYLSLSQSPRQTGSLFVRSSLDGTAVLASLRQILHELDPTLPVRDFMPLTDVTGRATVQTRLMASSLAMFAAIALGLAALGVYGVISYAVTQQRHEIGVRMALGADRRTVLLWVIKQSLSMIVPGSVLGLIGALGLSRLLANVLYGVRPHEPSTYVIMTCAVLVSAFLAALLPARRATRIDPIRALRSD